MRPRVPALRTPAAAAPRGPSVAAPPQEAAQTRPERSCRDGVSGSLGGTAVRQVDDQGGDPQGNTPDMIGNLTRGATFRVNLCQPRQLSSANTDRAPDSGPPGCALPVPSCLTWLAVPPFRPRLSRGSLGTRERGGERGAHAGSPRTPGHRLFGPRAPDQTVHDYWSAQRRSSLKEEQPQAPERRA